MPVKLSYEYVKEYCFKYGFDLISDKYINAFSKLRLKCLKEGHLFESKWNDISGGHGCPECHGNKRGNIDDVRKMVEERGYKLVSEVYVNSHSKLDMICDRGHKCSIRYNDFIRPSGCATCKSENTRAMKLMPVKDIEFMVSNRGYILNEIERVGHRTYLHITCKEGHNRKMTLDGFKSGAECKKCKDKEKSLGYDVVKSIITKRGFELVSEEYINIVSKLKIKCQCGHIFEKSLGDFKNQYQPCPRHRKDRSRGEKDVSSLVSDLYSGSVVLNDRNHILNPKTNHYLEMDIWLPELNKAIEYGDIWHHKDNIKYGKIGVEYRDGVKRQWFINNNIDVLYIDDKLWKKDRETQVERLKTFIGV